MYLDFHRYAIGYCSWLLFCTFTMISSFLCHPRLMSAGHLRTSYCRLYDCSSHTCAPAVRQALGQHVREHGETCTQPGVHTSGSERCLRTMSGVNMSLALRPMKTRVLVDLEITSWIRAPSRFFLNSDGLHKISINLAFFAADFRMTVCEWTFG